MFTPIRRLCLKTQISEDFLNILFLFPLGAVLKTTDYSRGFIILSLIFNFVQRLYLKLQISEDLCFTFFVLFLFCCMYDNFLLISPFVCLMCMSGLSDTAHYQKTGSRDVAE